MGESASHAEAAGGMPRSPSKREVRTSCELRRTESRKGGRMTDEGIVSAAHHEAGHAVLGKSQGLVPIYVEIRYNATKRRWEGTTEFPELCGPPIEEKIAIQMAICFAGCFAQVKYAIRALHPTEPIPWKELFEWMVVGSNEPLDISLSSGDTIHVPSWWFEGHDKQTLEYIADVTSEHLGERRFLGLLQKAVPRTTVPVLEDPKSWGKLEHLASLLVRAVDGGIARLDAAEIGS